MWRVCGGVLGLSSEIYALIVTRIRHAENRKMIGGRRQQGEGKQMATGAACLPVNSHSFAAGALQVSSGRDGLQPHPETWESTAGATSQLRAFSKLC